MDKEIDGRMVEHVALGLVWNNKKQVVLVLKNRVWILPGGHTDFSLFEDGTGAVFREVVEEIGIVVRGDYVRIGKWSRVIESKSLHRLYFIYEGEYAENDTKIAVSKLGKREGIDRVRWFSGEEIEGFSPSEEADGISEMARLAINKSRELRGMLFSQNTIKNSEQKVIFEKWLAEKKRRMKIKGEPRVLVVDDESQLLGVTTAVLKRIGIIVTAFKNPTRVLTQEKNYPFLTGIDLALIDWLMPEMNGINLIKEIIEINPNIKCILLTGDSDNKILKGYNGNILAKPVPISTLRKMIRESLKAS